jgi:hypothetical protein
LFTDAFDIHAEQTKTHTHEQLEKKKKTKKQTNKQTNKQKTTDKHKKTLKDNDFISYLKKICT